LASHGVCLREVNVVAGLPFGRQAFRLNVAGKVESVSGVSGFDCG
jgi:hypothetical protein